MPLPAAYFMVVLIWSTTPLTIQWSNSSLTFVAAVTLRMLLAFVICYAILRFKRQSLTNTPRDWLVFLASGLGLFPNMLLIYYAAQFIPSGLMSVLFGVLPFFVGVFSWLLLRENHFTRVRTLALVMAVTGLGIIHFGQMQVGPDAVKGVLIIMLVCVIWALSSVWVKQFGGSIEPMQQCTGSIECADRFGIEALKRALQAVDAFGQNACEGKRPAATKGGRRVVFCGQQCRLGLHRGELSRTRGTRARTAEPVAPARSACTDRLNRRRRRRQLRSL